MTKRYTLKEKMWLYPGKAAWYFVTVPPEITADIDYFFSMQKKGWGSLPVTVTIRQTTWKTSIFPDKKTHSYLLPIKAEIRKEETIQENELISFTIEIAS